MAQMVKNLPAIQETHVQFLGWEDPMEKEMAAPSRTVSWSFLACRGRTLSDEEPEDPVPGPTLSKWQS